VFELGGIVADSCSSAPGSLNLPVQYKIWIVEAFALVLQPSSFFRQLHAIDAGSAEMCNVDTRKKYHAFACVENMLQSLQPS